MTALGSFEVKMLPQSAKDAPIGRMSLDKHYQGDLAAVSSGEMLAFMSHMKGSAGYVAMEKVTGTLAGLSGSFVLQHSSTMTRGVPQQNIAVVPDSGTDSLQGLSGTLTIVVEGGKHSYVFEYSLSTEAQ